MSNTPPQRSDILHIAPGTARRLKDLTRLGRAALWYANKGWEVLPLYPLRNGLCSCPQGWDCQTPGMHPIPQGGKSRATAKAAVVVAWWSQCPDAGVALRPGPVSGFLVLRIDQTHGGEDVLRRFPELPETVQAHDGVGRRSLFFVYPAEQHLQRGAMRFGEGIELSAEGGYIIVPPTMAGGDRRYRWEPEYEPWRMPLAVPPPWLVSAPQANDFPIATSNPPRQAP